MAKNKKFWNTLLAGSDDKKHAAQTGEDPLEEGLKDLTWFESSKRAVQRGLRKTHETFGEEVGNSLTTGIPALYLLGLLPFAAIDAYVRATEAGMSSLSVIMTVIGRSAFIITLLLSLVMSCIYHFMKHGTPHKRIMDKVNRSVAYFAILGAYTPICINFLGPVSGPVLWALEAAMAVAGVLVTVLTYPHTKIGKAFTYIIYAAMSWAFVFRIVEFYKNASKLCFWLLLAGVIVYTVGIFFSSSKKRFMFSHMVWHFFVLAGVVLHTLGFVYFFG